MKILFVFLFVLLAKSGDAQRTDSLFDRTSSIVDIPFSSSGLFSKFSIATVKFANENTGLELVFISKPIKNAQSLRIDSIKLITDDKNFILNNPVKDTIYLNTDGSFSWLTIQIVQKTDLDFLRSHSIETVQMTYGNAIATIHLKKKSKKALRLMLNQQL